MSRGIPYLSIPIGCGLFLIQLAFFARRFVTEDFEFDTTDSAEAATDKAA